MLLTDWGCEAGPGADAAAAATSCKTAPYPAGIATVLYVVVIITLITIIIILAFAMEHL